MRKSRIKPVSDKQKVYNEEFGKTRDYLKQYRADWRCELRLHPDCISRGYCCDFRPLTAHHIRKRSSGGGNKYANLVVVCGDCHTICEGEDNKHKKPTREYLLDLVLTLNEKYGIFDKEG